MRFLAFLILAAQVTGCVWLPISSGDDSEISKKWSSTELNSWLGRSLDQVKTMITSEPQWTVSEVERSHLIYTSASDFGWFIVGGMYSAAGFITGDQTKCYRLSFNKDGRLYQYDRKLSTDFVDMLSSDETNDCRSLFWTIEELAEIRKSQQTLAAKGDQNAALRMAEEYGESGPLAEIALSTKDIDLARLLAEEYNNFGPLTELAADDARAEKALELASRTRKPQLISLAGLSNDEIIRLAEEGDPEAQYQQYLSNADQDSLKWLCRAADKGHPFAQSRLGDLYWTGAMELEKNLLLSYKWHRLSAVKGTHGSKLALVYVEAAMSPAQLSKAQQLYIDWVPGQCETEIAQHRIRH